MYETKLLSLLKNLNQKELKRFDDYLNSPYFFQGRNVSELIALFQYLQRFSPTYDHPKLSKQKVFSRLFPTQVFHERKFKHLMTKANKVLQGFIETHYQHQYLGPPPAFMNTLAFMREKDLAKKFLDQHRKATKLQAAQTTKDVPHYWYDFLLARELSDHYSVFNRRKTDLNLPQTLSQLDHFFVAAKLELACVFLDQSKYHVPLAANGCLDTMELLEPLFEAGKFKAEPLLHLLYQTYLLLKEAPNAPTFQELKKLYDQSAMKIGLTQRQLVHGVMRNYSTHQLNEGQEAYLQELFSLYQIGLTQGVLDSNGGLLSASFQNMVTLGLKVEDFDWVEQFLEDYRHKIIGLENSESLYALNRAQLFFAKKQFQEALDQLVFNFEDTYLKLSSRRLEVQIYYELNSPLLESKIQAFKIFIFRISKSHLPDLQRQGYTHFIDLVKQIIHPSTRFNPKRINSLLAKIQSKKVIAERKWLAQKIEALQSKE